MIARAARKLYGTSKTGLRFGIPALWARSLGLRPGDRVEVLFDEVLVLIPRASGQAERIRRALGVVEG